MRRLAGLKQLRLEAEAGLHGNPLVLGSQGQPVANPLARVVLGYDAEIRQLEDRLGLSPRARANLGISVGEAVKKLEDMFGSSAGSGPAVVEL